jgi:poly(A) polymerase
LTRLDEPWLRAAATRSVTGMLAGGGYRALFVGGCVRNALIGRPVGDIDIATDALPETVQARAEGAGLRAIPTGIAHGTITVVAAGRPFEITTLRRDVATDGRRAVVEFGTDIAEDAARRDFTMNALYARPDGTVLDPLGAGLADLAARRVRFVGEPERRIAEDYLRILRFFRFHAWYGDPESGLDPEGMAACAALGEGLARLSRERVGAELRKLLAAPDPAPSVAAMRASGILGRVLPGADTTGFAPLVHLEAAGGQAPNWLRRLAALGPAADWAEALRLSRAETRHLAAVAAALASGEGPAAMAYRHGADAARDAALIRAAALGQAPAPWLAQELARGAAAAMPVRAADLALQGPELGRELKRLEELWIAADFRPDRDALLVRSRAARDEPG